VTKSSACGPPKRGFGYLCFVGMLLLSTYPEYLVFRQRTNTSREQGPVGANSGAAPVEVRTPDDLIEDGYSQLRAALVADLRERIAAPPPAGFEQLVVDVRHGLCRTSGQCGDRRGSRRRGRN
jgi:restriction endonuclease Mrr